MRTDDTPGLECSIFTYREGVLSRVGHDLRLRVGRWEVTLGDGGATLAARFETASVRVAAAIRDGRDAPGVLSSGDVRQIEQAMADDVLEVRRFPTVTFDAKVARPADDRAILDGTLAIKGVRRPLVVEARVVGDAWTATVTLHQPDFGITPYRALLGALKIRPDLRVEVRVPRSIG
jgi:polyisoprenoid-binding protein YceI